MRGQWIGDYTGSSAGKIIVNIDERSSHFEGVVYLNEVGVGIPSIVTFFRTENKDPTFHFRSEARPIHPFHRLPDSWENVGRLYAFDVATAKSVDAHGSWNAHTLSLSWTIDTGASGKCTLPRSLADSPSELVPSDMEWASFKSHVATLEERRYLFRGQNGP